MNIFPHLRREFPALCTLAFGVVLVAFPTALPAQTPKAPVGKIYVAGVVGSSQATWGEHAETLAVKSIFKAQGSRIDTKPKGTLALVLTNGTGLFLDQDTHLEVRRFTQEPFTASRTDLEVEPSVSATEAYLAQGTLAVSTSKLAAGSSLLIQTALASINVHGGQIVITVESGLLTISVLEGESTVRAGGLELGGKVLHAGEQAVVRADANGSPGDIEVGKIPPGELAGLQDQAAMAYAARKTVFFESDGTGEINAVPVVPTSLPVQATVSPSQLPK